MFLHAELHCGTEPIGSVAMPVKKYGGKFLGTRLYLAPAQDPTQIFG